MDELLQVLRILEGKRKLLETAIQAVRNLMSAVGETDISNAYTNEQTPLSAADLADIAVAAARQKKSKSLSPEARTRISQKQKNIWAERKAKAAAAGAAANASAKKVATSEAASVSRTAPEG